MRRRPRYKRTSRFKTRPTFKARRQFSTRRKYVRRTGFKSRRMGGSRTALLAGQLFPRIKLNQLASGEITNKNLGIDTEGYIALECGYFPTAIKDLFSANSSGAIGKVHVQGHTVDALITNHMDQAACFDIWMMTAKDDIPVALGDNLGLVFQELIAQDAQPASPWNATPFGTPGWKPWLSEGIKQYFKMRHIGTRKNLMAGKSFRLRTDTKKAYSFAAAKYDNESDNYVCYKGNRFFFISVTGSPGLNVLDTTLHIQSSFGAFEVGFALRDQYTLSYMPFGNNQTGYQRLGTASTGTLAQTVTWHPSLQSGAPSSGAHGIN